MTIINAINKVQNETAFSLLEQVGFNTNTLARMNGATIELTESEDDVVMLVGDDVKIDAKGGNNTLYVIGDNASIDAKNGSNDVAVGGNNAKITIGDGNNLIQLQGNNGAITLGNGFNNSRVYGNNNTFTAGTGQNILGFIGNQNTVNLDQSVSNVAYWGDYNTIKVGGNSTVYTLDKAFAFRQFLDMENALIEKLEYTNSSEKVNSKVYYDYTMALDGLYGLMPKGDADFAETVDMTEKVDDKYPKYLVMPDDNGQIRLYVYSYVYKNKIYYYPYGQEGDSNVKVGVALKDIDTSKAAYEKYDCYTMIYSKNYNTSGGTGNNITFGDGDNILRASFADSSCLDNVDMGKANTGHTYDVATSPSTVSVKTSADLISHDILERKYYTIKTQ